MARARSQIQQTESSPRLQRSEVSVTKRRLRGFEATFGLVKENLRVAAESRGFALSRLLTQWVEVVGQDLGNVIRPVKIAYGREGLGATLTVLTTGGFAPMIAMRLDEIKKKVNAAYGYSAISRVVITQTAAMGFAEGRAEFAHAPKVHATSEDIKKLSEIEEQAALVAAPVADLGLRHALAMLACNILSRSCAKD